MIFVAEFDLVIDVGHGGKDPGAVKGNRHEEDYTLKISLYQYKRFKELGVNVGITRMSDVDLTNAQRTAIAKKGKFCISNHLNAGGGDRAEVIHSIYDNGRLANLIKDELVKVGQTSVKVYCKKGSSGDYYFMHRETGATVTNIVEYCFLDNEVDFAHFNANWEKYAEAVVKAFCQYIGNKYKEVKTEEKIGFVNVITGKYSEDSKALQELKDYLKQRNLYYEIQKV
jgi:N-acetylmuramoyl-L-alanine amidase